MLIGGEREREGGNGEKRGKEREKLQTDI